MERLNLKQSNNRTQKRKLGDLGENIACNYLEKLRFNIIDRNYSRKWGEIDIIAKKGNLYRFIEVKSIKVPHETHFNVPHVTSKRFGEYRPEDNVHPWKINRIHRAIQTYMLENRLDCDWQIDLITVKINETKRVARVELLENIF